MDDLNWIYMIEKMQETGIQIIMTEEDKECFAIITHEEGLTPMCLSKIMGVNKTIISRVIDSLNQGGYVVKTKDPRDKRSYFVSITELGREKVDKIYEYYLSPIYELRRKLGDEDFFELMSCIEKANQKMSQNE